MLRDFVETNREEILSRARRRVSERSAPAVTETELTHGLPVFLKRLRGALLRATGNDVADQRELKASAGQHGDDLFERGLTVEQVVHDYGDLCQVITQLAVEQKAAIGADEYQTLNLCLDDAIAGAVTTYAMRRERAVAGEETERLGVLAHEIGACQRV